MTTDLVLTILWLRALALAGPPHPVLEVPLDDLAELAGTRRPPAKA
jgi:hypothetical protein